VGAASTQQSSTLRFIAKIGNNIGSVLCLFTVCFWSYFSFYPCIAVLAMYTICLVYLSQVSVLLKRLDGSSWFLPRDAMHPRY